MRKLLRLRPPSCPYVVARSGLARRPSQPSTSPSTPPLGHLQAIGQQNLLEMEEENKRRREGELRALIDERKAELARLEIQLRSLEKVEQEQRALIEKLSNFS
jgi:Intraflagellar transport complex B, subunit 20